MKLLTPRRRSFYTGMLSAFRMHSNRYFLVLMEDFNRKSDLERMQEDLERVGADMHKALHEQIEQPVAVR